MTSSRDKCVFVISLGCAKNLVDSEVMCGGLATAGFVLTDAADAADVMLVNTCSFIADARAEADREIARAVKWKRGRRGRRVVVAGCLPQRNLAEAQAAYPQVDLFLGLDDVPRVAGRLAALFAGGAGGAPVEVAESATLPPPTYLYDHLTPRLQLTPRNYAYVKIADGCDHHCRFCAIPAIRGRERSRDIPSILAECRQLLGQGVRELNLIAQDTTRFGADRRDGTSLAALLERGEAELEGDFWLRVLYTHPRHFDDAVLTAFANARRLVRYVDIPLQHISDPVLRAMGRGLGEAATHALMERIRRDIPGVAVRTTFLVGYPGETEADFETLLAFVGACRFDRLGVFAFSPEAGTPAAEVTAGLVPAALAQERRARLLALQQEISLARNQALVGKRLRVLVEARAGKGRFLGRTAADAPDVDNQVRFTGPADSRERGFVNVRIDRAEPYDLDGHVEAR
ncbi:MAG: Ribosomal protein S12 methylthiotransferase RimO [Lentisphaerae bacterium ADurb.BinA184]|nr:MAG: Ribosomal protein S12 methylthiotransferase RimO [Lentisphaerae bacterium ADurb.BinA184]